MERGQYASAGPSPGALGASSAQELRPRFTDEETEAERSAGFVPITQLVVAEPGLKPTSF